MNSLVPECDIIFRDLDKPGTNKNFFQNFQRSLPTSLFRILNIEDTFCIKMFTI